MESYGANGTTTMGMSHLKPSEKISQLHVEGKKGRDTVGTLNDSCVQMLTFVSAPGALTASKLAAFHWLHIIAKRPEEREKG